MPAVLKNGRLSTNKTQKTTHALFLQALRNKTVELVAEESDIPISEVVWNDYCEEFFEGFCDDYGSYLDYLKEKEDNEGSAYFNRLSVVRSDAELEASMVEFTQVAKETVRSRQILAKGKESHIYRHITADCQWDCDYKALCKASMDGSNTSLIKASLYTTKEEI
jgi:hypothetical protein